MQTDGGAYVQQIPPGTRAPSPSPPPVLKITPSGAPERQRPPPPGLYVQVATVPTQNAAVEAGLQLAQRLGSDRPPFIRGEAVSAEGRTLLRLYAGPFADAAAAARFCSRALGGQTCIGRMFSPNADPRPSTTDPERAAPKGVAARGGLA